MSGRKNVQKQSLPERFDELESSYVGQVEEIQTKLSDLLVKVKQHEQENAKLKSELSNLQEENKLLVNATTNKEQINALESRMAQMQKERHDNADKWNKEREAMLQDVKILKAKLTKEREQAKEHDQQVSHEFEEKFVKMKNKMKTLYETEMSKVKAKHKVVLMEYSTEMQRCTQKIKLFDGCIKLLTIRLHVKNDQYLTLLKDNEIMKSKMRTLEHNAPFPNMKPAQMNIPASCTGVIQGGNGTFKIKCEPVDVYNENFLVDLENGGSFAVTSRNNRRNSMIPPY